MIKADRSQLHWDVIDLEAFLPEDHRARVVWDFVESLDLSELYAAIRSREGGAGGRQPIRRFCSRCGSMPRLRALARRVSLNGLLSVILPIGGWLVGCR